MKLPFPFAGAAAAVLTAAAACAGLRAWVMDTTASGTRPPGAIRNWRERVTQTLWFEALGLVSVSPLFAHFAGASTREAFIVLTVLSVAVMCWQALYNMGFDLIELRCSGRLASDRPHGWRVVHTVGLEATAVVVTWPLIVALTSLGWRDAVVAEIGLTLAYALYGYCFHLLYDHLRPVRTGPRSHR